MVPKIIHCCWFGGSKTPLAEKCRASWGRFASEWTVKSWEWSEKTGLLVEGVRAPDRLRQLPGFAFFEAALKARKWAMASDWLRMAVLHLDGGVYLDYDVELIRPFAPQAGEWVASEWTASGGTWMNPGSGIALERGSVVARSMLEAYESTSFDPGREMMPWINDHLRAAGTLCVLPPEVFSPIDMRGRLRKTDATLGIHHYALSWGGPKRKILQWLSWHGFRWLVDFAVRVKRGLRSR